jgi:glucose-6-phosphate-specific signal transduction histidine kinase
LANIITHVSPKSVQIDISTEGNRLVIEFVYAAKTTFTNYLSSTLLSFRGRGLSIINDRLKIIGGTNDIKNTDGYTIDSIFIPL